MHRHPLLKHLLLPKSPKPIGAQSGETDAEHLEPDEQGLLFLTAIADCGARFYCLNRLAYLEDPSDGFSGFDYLTSQALLFNAMQEALLAQQLTSWDRNTQFEHLSTRKKSGNDGRVRDDRYLEAEMFAEALVRESCQSRVSNSIKGNTVFLGGPQEKPGNEDADHVESTFAAYLRYASVFLEQTREMKGEPWERLTEVGET